jgi:hypothetical protein
VHVLEPQDSAVIFSAAIFLLTSLGLTQYIYYITKEKLQKYTSADKLTDTLSFIPKHFSGPAVP